MLISLRNKIGQMLIMGFSGTELNEQSPVVDWLQKDGLGGVLLFDFDSQSKQYGKNLVNTSQIRHLLYQLNHYSKAVSSYTEALPLLTAIDYEGGAVDRLSHIEDMMDTMSASKQAMLSDETFTEEIQQMATGLKSLGINLNFAPVVDLNLNCDSGVIGRLERSFSDDPETVTRLARHFVNIFNREGIVCAYKHFPGHGSAKEDSHEDAVDVTHTFLSKELIPYQQLIPDGNVSVMIMTAHVINRLLDESGLPASLSHKLITELLRKEYGFEGVVISDDLQMPAIAKYFSLSDSLTLAINAGTDMLIFANQFSSISASEVIDCIEGLIHQGRIAIERIDEAYTRIVCLKKALLF
ncbi:beta-N-acetylhexosaminidase [Legionella israelensis]|uniref:beta-N-acetylhexosaminidase n=1 Tax=Legionella israelensis TaxID=454 RepID=A0A0W0WE87_9GAMM|nr:glycosyl hydrolase [Legionella israelensis]SCY32341.1 beta-N-acetylhexosaminidase [Legionella israelensis DSM 19235]STX57743.1 beta-N-acetylhexosaminidase [Legionella israelensis]